MISEGRDKTRIAIIGGGISGLSAAWEFSRSGMPVDIYERERTLGGLAGWFEVGGTTLEKFYHHIYNRDADLIQLISEVGLRDHLVFRETVTGCFYVNKIYRLSTPMDLLRYKPLSFPDRIRLGLLMLKARRVKDWKQLDTISAKEWIIRNAGQTVFKIIWEPLFRSKFGSFASEVSAAWLWSKLVERGGSRGKGGAEQLGYMVGGYGLLFNEMERQLLEKGIRIFKSTPVNQIVIDQGSATGLIVDGETRKYDAILVTTQLPDYLKIGSSLPFDYSNAISKIGFLGNATLVMRMTRRLSDTYWVNVTDVTCPFVGVIEQTNLLGEEHYQGNHLAYISRYMETSDPLYSMDAEQLYGVYSPYIQKVFPEFRREWIAEIMVWREPCSQAVVSVGFNQKIPLPRTPVSNLYLSTMAQIFPEDRQMSNGVKFARQTARMIIETCSQKSK